MGEFQQADFIQKHMKTWVQDQLFWNNKNKSTSRKDGDLKEKQNFYTQPVYTTATTFNPCKQK